MRRSSWTWNTPYSLIFSPFLTAFSRSLTLWSLLPVKYCRAAPNDSGSTPRTSAWMPTSSTTLERVGPFARTCFTLPKAVNTSITGSGFELVTRISMSPIDSFMRRRLPATLTCLTSFTPRRAATSSWACGRTWPIGSRSLVRRNNAIPFRIFSSGGDRGDVFCQTFQRPGGAAVGGDAEGRLTFDLQHVGDVVEHRRNSAILHQPRPSGRFRSGYLTQRAVGRVEKLESWRDQTFQLFNFPTLQLSVRSASPEPQMGECCPEGPAPATGHPVAVPAMPAAPAPISGHRPQPACRPARPAATPAARPTTACPSRRRRGDQAHAWDQTTHRSRR